MFENTDNKKVSNKKDSKHYTFAKLRLGVKALNVRQEPTKNSKVIRVLRDSDKGVIKINNYKSTEFFYSIVSPCRGYVMKEYITRLGED